MNLSDNVLFWIDLAILCGFTYCTYMLWEDDKDLADLIMFIIMIIIVASITGMYFLYCY